MVLKHQLLQVTSVPTPVSRPAYMRQAPIYPEKVIIIGPNHDA